MPYCRVLSNGTAILRAVAVTAFALPARAAKRALGTARKRDRSTAGLARCLQSASISSSGALLAQFAAPEIRKIWTPDAENFFGRIRADLLDGLWVEMLGLEEDDERWAEFAKLKRKEKAKELEALFADASAQEAHGLSRNQVARIDAWLPEEMN